MCLGWWRWAGSREREREGTGKTKTPSKEQSMKPGLRRGEAWARGKRKPCSHVNLGVLPYHDLGDLEVDKVKSWGAWFG